MNTEEIKVSTRITCFSFTRHDFMIMLCIYNATYFLLNYYITHNVESSFVVALIMMLFAMFLLTAFGVLGKFYEVDLERKKKDAQIEQEIKNEFKSAHKIHQRRELLKKAICLSEKSHSSKNLEQEEENKVHIDYLNRTDTSA